MTIENSTRTNAGDTVVPGFPAPRRPRSGPARVLRPVPSPPIDPRDREIWEAVALVEEAADRMRDQASATWWLDVQAGMADSDSPPDAA